MCLAIPGKIESIIENDEFCLRTGRVSFGGTVREANLACVPEARVGDYVLVHAGLAINMVQESEANKIFEYLQEIDELEDMDSRGETVA